MSDDRKRDLIEQAREAVRVAQDSIWRTSPDADGDARHEAMLDQMLAVFEAAQKPTPKLVDARDPECVKVWPECASMEYDPRCCRFPKSCSAGGWVTQEEVASREDRDPRERAEYLAASKADAAMADWRPGTDREDGSAER